MSCLVVLFSVLFGLQLSVVRPNRSQVALIELPCSSRHQNVERTHDRCSTVGKVAYFSTPDLSFTKRVLILRRGFVLRRRQSRVYLVMNE